MLYATFVQKAAALLLTGLAVFYLSPFAFITLFIVAGHGHFFASYLYQWKAGKVTARFVGAYIVFALLLFYWITHGASLIDLLVIAGITFLLHHFYDEITLFSLKRNRATTLAIIPAAFAYLGLLLAGANYLPMSASTYALISCGVFAACITFSLRYAEREEYPLIVYGAAVALGVTDLLWYVPHPPLTEAFGSLVIFHYVCWYVFYGFKLSGVPAKLYRYIGEMVGMNVLAVILYFIYVTAPGAQFLYLLFAPAYFYGWTILHIASSFAQALIPKLLGFPVSKH